MTKPNSKIIILLTVITLFIFQYPFLNSIKFQNSNLSMAYDFIFNQNITFEESFENKLKTENILFSKYFNETIKSSNKISFVNGKTGKGIHLDSLDSFIGYSSKYFNPDEGTIRFYYKPDPNIYEFYNTRQPEWKDFGNYKPPFTGYLIDTVGYLESYKGAIGAAVNFSGDKNNKNITVTFSTFYNIWSTAEFKTKGDFILSSDKFYDFAFTWSKKEGKIKIFIDGELRGSSNYNTEIDNNGVFFLGQNPFQNYWPYGPHSLIGTYDELKIYSVSLTEKDLKPIPEEPPKPPTTQQPPNQLTIILQINNPYMTVNGVKKEIDPGRGTVPVIVKGRTLVPIRAIIEEMGGTIEWDGNERKVTISLKETKIELWIDKKSARVNGTLKELDVPPQIINGRTMLPLRFVTEELGCTVEWDGNTKTITINYNLEAPSEINKVSSEGEKVFTSSGGELTLSDGTKLIVPPNSFSKDTKVTLKSIINPYFSTVDTLGFEITGLKELKGEITLYAYIQKGFKDEELQVFGYDHETEEKIDFQYNYDSNSGEVSVKISPSSLLGNNNLNYLLSNKFFKPYSYILGLKDKLLVYIGWTKYYSPKSSEKIIRMPYYEQIGGSCVSTSAQMLLKYGGREIKLFEILRDLKAKDNDFGINQYTYANELRDYLSRKLGFTIIHIPYFGIAHLKWRILSEIDEGHPVILNWGKHTVVVLGYKNYGNEIIIHDPQNITPATNENGTMYTIRNWNWIRERHQYKTEKYYIIYPKGGFASYHGLSLMCPGRDENGAMSGGEISFYIIHPNTKKLTSIYELQIKPSEKNGYIWINKSYGNKLDLIPQDAEILKLKLNVFNSSNITKNAEVKVVIYENKDGYSGKKITENKKTFTIKEAKFNEASLITYENQFKLEDIRDFNLSDQNGVQKILIYAYLYEEGITSIRDIFDIEANLNVKPKVTSVNPDKGRKGDIITINGFSFGKNKTTKSKVMIGNEKVEIISWSDKEIKVKLTKDDLSGPVVVYTGEKYDYESNKDIIFNFIDPYEGTYALNIKWSDIDCKICNFPETLSEYSSVKIVLKEGKIEVSRINMLDYFSWEGDGYYDKNGNVVINFKGEGMIHFGGNKYTITGTLKGKFPDDFKGVGVGQRVEFKGNIKQKCTYEVLNFIDEFRKNCCNKTLFEKEYSYEITELVGWWH